MTIDDLKTHPVYVTLGSPQQQEWVVAYCSNGADKVKATETAYATNDEASTVAIANRNVRHPAIRQLINEYFGRVDEKGNLDQALALLWRRINSPGMDDRILIQYLALYGRWNGFETEKRSASADADSPVDSVDDLVRQLEEKGKV